MLYFKLMKKLEISGKTAITGIIGYPISHTFSPIMHNKAFKYLNLNFIYLPFLVKEKDLRYAIRAIRALNIVGVNVTIPHKEKVIKYLDETSSDVKKIGAVNTILNKNGKLIGFNTDKFGFVQPLVSQNVELKNKKIMVLGCGGASRAVCFGLLENNISSLLITDIIKEKAIRLKRDLRKFYKDCKIEIVHSSSEIIFNRLKDIDILVNATPVGMKPDSNSSPVYKIPKENKKLIVYDLVYNPVRTKLLNLAEKQNLKTINGIEMLIYQGAKAFEIWTGKQAPVDIMKGVVYETKNSKEF